MLKSCGCLAIAGGLCVGVFGILAEINYALGNPWIVPDWCGHWILAGACGTLTGVILLIIGALRR